MSIYNFSFTSPSVLFSEMRQSADSALKLRVKREERVLENGCLSHTTAVAAGALAMYVRYIAEYQQMVFEQNQIFN